ncbi:MAG TPA: DUF4215 domain-containing protein [Archangium sp.]|uniref:DUF4215 domain-containing protein n=1 Tax=Archangium sp. TaxID=1872627 RepID=UPI002E378B57|nr:DUF4215 domain-containing protein [Archangium sp.]HEX5749351.1 DUF4215 domain-containing protein [Archangium sp.]
MSLLVLSLCACMEPKSVLCSSGRACPSGQKCAASQDVCIKTDCGDGILQAGEACDDGNILDGDGCSRTCESVEACGNGVLDSASGEVCDDGNTRDGDGCSANCKSNEKCGNGVVDVSMGEKCDDGNTRSADGCSADCLSDETCGNHYTDSVIGEVCDDGNRVAGDGCSADCHSGEVCGNKILDRGEACDEGNTDNTADCLSDCTLARCGDGHVNTLGAPEHVEACDDGRETAACNSNCTLPACGDGIVNVSAGEVCDDGNGSNNDSCLNNCTAARCGDGYLNVGTEQCDDGNAGACGTCSASCIRLPATEAKGLITVPEGKLLEDGEVFSISDGRKRVFFEFDRDGQVSRSHVPIVLGNDWSAEDVAQEVFNSILFSPKKLSMNVEHESKSMSVSFTHKSKGAFANNPIIQSVENEGFVVDGMTGGVGRDCEKDARCSVDEDCVQGLGCRGGFCK